MNRYYPLLLLFLLAFALRLWQLDAVPPGLTHDEADHIVTAWEIVQGARPVYSPIAYGREPLYDYLTAMLMSITGPSWFPGRLTSALASLLVLATTYAWLKTAFNGRVALLATAGLTVNFWVLMVSRQGLRTITLPLFFGLAVWLWWQWRHSQPTNWRPWLGAAVCLGLAFYTYLPVRVMWLLFPAVCLYWLLFNRPALARYGWGTMGLVVMALLIASPMFWYLYHNPTAEVRVGQLTGAITAAQQGDWLPLARNFFQGFRIIGWAGDTAWRYNIPGRPLLLPLPTLFFTLGWLVLAWEWFTSSDKQHKETLWLVVVWFFLALSPVLLTGAELSTTRAIGLLPLLTLFPAVGLDRLLAWGQTAGKPANYLWPATAALFLLFLYEGLDTIQSYWVIWGQNPEVRVQYESSLVTMLAHINQQEAVNGVISTTTPHPLHSSAVALGYVQNPQANLSWFDGRSTLLLPASDQTLTYYFSGFAPLQPVLAPLLEPATTSQTLPTPTSDRDQPLMVYEVEGALMRQRWAEWFTPSPAELLFGSTLRLSGYHVNPTTARPGENIMVISWWTAEQPFEPEVVLFTQLLRPDGTVLSQADVLGVPTFQWQPGVEFAQLHVLTIPPHTPAGEYKLIVGAYTRPGPDQFQRLLLSQNGQPAGDFYTVPISLTLP